MRCVDSSTRPGGFTLVEMLVVLAIIGLLAALLLPALAGGKQRARRIVCESQLRQIGIAFQSFSHDHNSKFPMQVSTNDSGSAEFVQAGLATNGVFFFGYKTFQSLSGFLPDPGILVCPADLRPPAPSFATLDNSNLSYFAGVNAQYDQPMSILSGDGNLASSTTMVYGPAGGRLTWNRQLHIYKGNVLFSDGHVEEWSDTGGAALAGGAEMSLPTVGGGGSGSGAAGAGSTGGFASGGAGSGQGSSAANAGAPAGPEPAGADWTATAGAGQPASPAAASPAQRPQLAGHFTNPRNESARGTSAAAPEGANAPDQTAAATPTNAAGSKASETPAEELMSPAQRQMAHVMRGVLGGGYLLLLLAALAYLAYRTWRKHYARQYHRRTRTDQ